MGPLIQPESAPLPMRARLRQQCLIVEVSQDSASKVEFGRTEWPSQAGAAGRTFGGGPSDMWSAHLRLASGQAMVLCAMTTKPTGSVLLPPCDTTVQIVEDVSPAAPAGFLRLVRRRLAIVFGDGRRSAPFEYDEVDRVALDAVVIAAHYVEHGVRWVYLRSAIRPPIALRDPDRCCNGEAGPRQALWELPAGLIEPCAPETDAVTLTAQRELHEELGFSARLEDLHRLGPATFPAPGFVSECHFYFEVEVDPTARSAPSLDGSALEAAGVVVALPLDDALRLCHTGEIVDAKTELALRRLEEATS
jgi:ADP-ribose pyrophosphatase